MKAPAALLQFSTHAALRLRQRFPELDPRTLAADLKGLRRPTAEEAELILQHSKRGDWQTTDRLVTPGGIVLVVRDRVVITLFSLPSKPGYMGTRVGRGYALTRKPRPRRTREKWWRHGDEPR